MRTSFLVGTIVAASLGVACVTNAATPTPTITPTQTPTVTPTPTSQPFAKPGDQTNFLGDSFVYKQEIRAYIANFNEKSQKWEKGDAICIPPGTYLRGLGAINPNDLSLVNLQLVVKDCDYLHPLWWCNDAKTFTTCALHDPPGPRDNWEIKGGRKIIIDRNETDLGTANRYGWTYGGLVAPFKFQLKGHEQFVSAATAAPYMGYRFGFEQSGIELCTVGFAGVSNVSTSSTATAGSSNLAAFSYGGGVVGNLKNGGFNFGAVIGLDHVGGGQNYQYNDKPWLALQLGYQLSK